MTAARTSRTVMGGLLLALVAGVAGAASSANAPQGISPLIIGSTVPELTLRTSDGDRYDLGAAMEGKPTVLVFYRGGW
jgi:cytochrome oxidase Cu insertion factor (SCO1/SenC/PrrC family)